jgi:signal transduction histidine kinase
MKKGICLIIFGLMTILAWAQPDIAISQANSLKKALAQAPNDSSRVLILAQLSRCYTATNLRIAEAYSQKGFTLAAKIGYGDGKLLCALSLGFIKVRTYDHAKALQLLFEAKEYAESHGKFAEQAKAISYISSIYALNKDYEKALKYMQQAKSIQKNHRISEASNPINLPLGVIYRDMGNVDSALTCFQKAFELQTSNELPYISSTAFYLADLYAKMGQPEKAFQYYRKCIFYSTHFRNDYALPRAQLGLAKLFEKMGKLDSTIYYSKKVLTNNTENPYFYMTAFGAATLLAEIYNKDQRPNEALKYYKIASTAKDSLFSIDKMRRIEKIMFEEKDREMVLQRQLEANRLAFQNQIRLYSLSGILVTILVILFIVYRNNHQKQKANARLQEQKEKVESALSQLRATQAQLIQSEKLASLGELTAGIAHEIQNPLNFVNNFAEISVDLAKEINEEIDKDPIDKEFVKELMGDLTQNQQKINHHGQRASAIVKGMLEHSRSRDVIHRVSTDLNALADEYLRLSYHGLRAKDSSFNATMETHFDPELPKIEVIPQDIGRVLLNLINNAFYAVNQRNNAVETLHATSLPYQPTVTVSTKKLAAAIEISVKDNGNGIPEAIKDKIFQPFFTTKPTGQGTGLGLSLAYDIVTKGHGGTLNFESKAGVGTTFVLNLRIENA